MKTLFLGIFLFTISTAFQSAYATNPISVEIFHELGLEKHKTEKTSIFSKAKKWAKKFITAAYSSSTLKKMAIIGLLAGLLSILGWLVVGTVSGVLWAMVILALLGDVLSIMTLWNSRKDKESNRGARTMAWIGLVLSLLTGILPIVVLILVLASL